MYCPKCGAFNSNSEKKCFQCKLRFSTSPTPSEDSQSHHEPQRATGQSRSYEQQPAYAQSQPYEQQPAYAQSQPYEQQPVYAQSQPYEQQPAYAQSQSYEQQPAYAQSQPYEQQPAYAQSQSYEQQQRYRQQAPYQNPPYAPQSSPPSSPPYGNPHRQVSRLGAGILALIGGFFGAHKFYIGNRKAAHWYLWLSLGGYIFSLLFFRWLVWPALLMLLPIVIIIKSIGEGLHYLSMDDYGFYEIYVRPFEDFNAYHR